MVRERLRHGVPGLPLLPLVLLPLAGIPFFRAGRQASLAGNDGLATVLFVTALAVFPILWIFLLKGFFMVAPNEAKVTAALRQLHGHRQGCRIALGEPLLQQDQDFAAGAQLREFPTQGQRSGWQSHRHRRRRGVAGRRNGGSDVRGKRLRELRQECRARLRFATLPRATPTTHTRITSSPSEDRRPQSPTI